LVPALLACSNSAGAQTPHSAADPTTGSSGVPDDVPRGGADYNLSKVGGVFRTIGADIAGSIKLVRAERSSVYFAGGSATDSSAGPLNTLGGGKIYDSGKMGGFFETIGADNMFRPHFGVGAEVTFRKNQGSYASLNYRPKFYDINIIYQPLSYTRRIVPEIQGGMGRMNLNYYFNAQFCKTYPEGCNSYNAEVSSVTHLQLHLAGGVRVYIVRGFFLRPQVDIHWVNNFHEFGSSWVPEYSTAIGYTIRKNQ
jgi:hypothetical protein